MFEGLSEKLGKAFKVLKGHGKITEVNVSDTLKEIRKALLSADVSYNVAKVFVNRVKDKAIGRDVLKTLSPGQLMTKIIHEELTALMGENAEPLSLSGSPAVVLLCGLQGSGKTTFSAKLANLLKSKKGRNPLLVGCDVYRPAAMEQLKILAESTNVNVYIETENKNPLHIAQKALDHAKKEGYDTVIVDTAGRLAVDDELMKEIKALHDLLEPCETLFVVDAMTGQDAVNTAQVFHDLLAFNGVILTKLDSDTRGGAALTIKETIGKPIKFIGTGEKMEAIDTFHPSRMADRILGMGDVVSLVEKVQEQINDAEAQKLQQKIAKNQFDFEDYMAQMGKIKKMGNMKNLLSMIPGASKMTQGMGEVNDDVFKGIEAIISSMTPQERKRLVPLDTNRKNRIASGSGRGITEVNRFLKQFDQLSKVMKMIKGGKMNPNNMLNMFQKQ